MSTITAIPRLNLKALTPLDARVDLAKEAQAKLGYNKLALAIASPDALLFSLRELEIEPLAPEKVRDYKRSKETMGWYSGTKKVLWATALALLFTPPFAAGMVGANTNDPWSRWHYGLNVLLGICAAITIVYALSLLMMGEVGSGKRKVCKWADTALSRYEGNVPEFVLSKALQINGAQPETHFTVEYLVEHTEHYTRPKPDPFLVASLKNESYYIDVWNEKEYETRL